MAGLTTLIDELRGAMPGRVIAEADALPAYGDDFWTHRGTPGVVVRAETEDDVMATLRHAMAHGIPVVPRGAGTNVSAGYMPTPARILLDLRAMNRILTINAAAHRATVQPGVLNGDVQARLAPLGLCFSPDPASRAISTIGGNIAENAGGPHCLKYGVTVHHIEAVTCVLPDGDRLRLAAGDAGPDLLGLIIGSEGTLGVVTEATLRLRSLPEATHTLLAIFASVDAAAAVVSATMAAGIVPAAMELMDRVGVGIFEGFAPSGYPRDAEALLLIDVDGTAAEAARDLAAVEAIVRRAAREVRRAEDRAARDALWRGRILGAQAIAASGRGYLIGDTTVPRERIPAMQRRVRAIAQSHDVTILVLGHAGDGNIHPITLFDRDNAAEVARVHAANAEIVAAALALGGTLTGEHGIGSEKRGLMAARFAPAEIAAMRAVKGAFDPAGICNPDILLPDRAPDEPAAPRFAAAVRAALAARRAGHSWTPPDAPMFADNRDDAGEIALDAANLTATVGAATPLGVFRDALAASGFIAPFAPGDDATPVGAVIAGGIQRAAVRDALLGARVTLPDGATVTFGRGAVKDVAGYDLKRLLIGGGGAFGMLHAATFRVAPLRR